MSIYGTQKKLCNFIDKASFKLTESTNEFSVETGGKLLVAGDASFKYVGERCLGHFIIKSREKMNFILGFDTFVTITTKRGESSVLPIFMSGATSEDSKHAHAQFFITLDKDSTITFMYEFPNNPLGPAGPEECHYDIQFITIPIQDVI